MRDEYGNNDAERWFERYLADHGYSYEYEPDLGVAKRPDFLIERSSIQIVCEVKAFEKPPALHKKLDRATGPVMVSDDDVYGPMRSSVREAAKQLKPLAESGLPLVVVLANPLGYWVHLDMERLIEAMFGNPGWAGPFDAETGTVGEMEFEYGRDGRLRNDHPYISAVAILREVDLTDEYRADWRTGWKRGRAPVTYKDDCDDWVQEIQAELDAWESHTREADIPHGNTYRLEVLATGSEGAVPLPENVFDCVRDTRVSVERA